VDEEPKTGEIPSGVQSELEQLRDALEKSRREVADSRRLAQLGQLAAGIGHELRQPLGAIGALLYLLRSALAERSTTPQPERLLDEIERELSHAWRIISNLLDYARGRQPARAPLNLNRLVERQAGKLKLPAEIHLETQLAPNLPHVFADPLHLESALQNLLQNAVDSMAIAGGVLCIETRVAAGAVLAEVRDTGEGIPEGLHSRIFQPLFTTREKGAGLGLALTRQLVEANGGSISFSSQAGRGTCFQLRFPATAV
jgi:signal transduction histidine kinase